MGSVRESGKIFVWKKNSGQSCHARMLTAQASVRSGRMRMWAVLRFPRPIKPQRRGPFRPGEVDAARLADATGSLNSRERGNGAPSRGPSRGASASSAGSAGTTSCGRT